MQAYHSRGHPSHLRRPPHASIPPSLPPPLLAATPRRTPHAPGMERLTRRCTQPTAVLHLHVG
eukprot:6064747-Prymnesium_polylepis.1